MREGSRNSPTEDRRNIPAGEFKAHCLEIMDIVNHDKVEYVITKRGVPVAKIVPVIENETESTPFGYMKGTLIFSEDIVSPVDIPWEVLGEEEDGF